MSKEALEKFRAELEANRAAKFQRKLTELFAEIEQEKELDDFLIQAQMTPAPALAAIG
jgi:hypothetical protein